MHLCSSGALIVPTATAVPGSSNSVNKEYVEYNITIGRGVSQCHISENADTTWRRNVLRLLGWRVEMNQMSGRVMVFDAKIECGQERMWMDCRRNLKLLSAQHRTLANSQRRKSLRRQSLLAERRLVDAVGSDEVIVLEAVRERRKELQVNAGAIR